MAVFNRRNAALGWLAWTVGKRVLKHKAKSTVPKVDLEERRPNKSAVALFAATVGGVVFFLRRRTGGDDDDADG